MANPPDLCLTKLNEGDIDTAVTLALDAFEDCRNAVLLGLKRPDEYKPAKVVLKRASPIINAFVDQFEAALSYDDKTAMLTLSDKILEHMHDWLSE